MLTPMFALKDMRHEYRFEPNGDRTRLTVNGEFEMVGGLTFAGGLMRRVATKFNQRHLEAAKRALEAG
jgi:carbon monoxide dehydrogenase subunit G